MFLQKVRTFFLFKNSTSPHEAMKYKCATQQQLHSSTAAKYKKLIHKF